MKRREREGGFPWIGTFVVLFVLAVIIGLLFPPTPPGRDGHYPRRSEAAITVRNIVAALKAFHSEYGHFPEIGKPRADGKFMVYVGDPACKASENPNSVLFDVLRAIPRGPNANHALNPKQLIFMEGMRARNPKNPQSGFADGPEFSAKDQGCYFDPWGRQYCIVFTTDDSGSADLSAVYSDLTGPEHLLPGPVAAFSLGRDGLPGGKGHEGRLRKPASSEAPDDVFSWQ